MDPRTTTDTGGAARTPLRIAVSGGPGAGKTTTLEALAARGHTVVPEVARRIIAERRAAGLPPRPPPAEFAEAILAADQAQYTAVAGDDGPVFFDRSVVDALGMLHGTDALPEARRKDVLSRHPLYQTVFIFPPWQAIYRQDAERDQTWEDAVRVHASLRRWYLDCGFTIADVPTGSVADRATFILDTLGLPAGG